MAQCKQGRRDSKKLSLQVKDFQMDVKGAMQAYKEGATRKKKKCYDKAQQSSTTGDKWINEHADNYYM